MANLLLYITCTILFLGACRQESTTELDAFSADTATLDTIRTSNRPSRYENSGNFTTTTGMASYYADRLHGRPTASGELYDTAAFTAAHRTLPFGTVVKVTHLSTGASVEVRINDRGPHTQKRIIDLSKAAARALGMYKKGIARVRLEVVQEQTPSTSN
jgi:rare lipoprotein A